MGNDTPKQVFLDTWGEGYAEDWRAYKRQGFKQEFDDVLDIVQKFLKPQMKCVELGMGSGEWTERLVDMCRLVIGLDLTPFSLFTHSNFRYIEVPDRNFNCYGVASDSVDFVFSFGLFCHLSCDAQQTYLKNIHRILKHGGHAVIAFANWDRHPDFTKYVQDFGYSLLYKNCRIEEEGGQKTETIWFYNDLENAMRMVSEAGFVDVVDEMPDFRDTILSFKKP